MLNKYITPIKITINWRRSICQFSRRIRQSSHPSSYDYHMGRSSPLRLRVSGFRHELIRKHRSLPAFLRRTAFALLGETNWEAAAQDFRVQLRASSVAYSIDAGLLGAVRIDERLRLCAALRPGQRQCCSSFPYPRHRDGHAQRFRLRHHWRQLSRRLWPGNSAKCEVLVDMCSRFKRYLWTVG